MKIELIIDISIFFLIFGAGFSSEAAFMKEWGIYLVVLVIYFKGMFDGLYIMSEAYTEVKGVLHYISLMIVLGVVCYFGGIGIRGLVG